MQCSQTVGGCSASSLQRALVRGPLLVVLSAALVCRCGAPRPTPTGHEYDEFLDEPVVSHGTDATDSKRAPSGHRVMDCGTETTGTVSVSAAFDEEDNLVIQWQGSNALAVLVTDTEAVLPAGPTDRVQGTAFWVVGTVAFPDGFRGPVVYGTVPDGGEDITAYHSGPTGGTPLKTGTCYKISVTNNAFCTGSVVRGWE